MKGHLVIYYTCNTQINPKASAGESAVCTVCDNLRIIGIVIHLPPGKSGASVRIESISVNPAFSESQVNKSILDPGILMPHVVFQANSGV